MSVDDRGEPRVTRVETEKAAEPIAPPRAVVFGDFGDEGRGSRIRLAVPLLIGLVLLALVVALVAVAAVVGIRVGLDPEAAGDPAAAIEAQMLSTITIFALSFFPSLAILAILWTRLVEKRPLASMGFSGAAPVGRYLRGLLGGVLLAVVMMAVASALLAVTGLSEEEALGVADLSLLGRPDYVRLMIGAVLVLLIQSASEEILCRGWMLSSVAARAGIPLAILVSSLGFGLLHIDRALIGPFIGLGVIAGTGMVGAAFAVWALREGGIYGVAGAHGGFNATLVSLALGTVIVHGEGADVGALFSNMMASMNEQLASSGALVQVLAQVLVFGALAFVLGRRYFLTRSVER